MLGHGHPRGQVTGVSNTLVGEGEIALVAGVFGAFFRRLISVWRPVGPLLASSWRSKIRREK